MLYILSLEPLPERYTIQWERWFKRELVKHEVAFEFIEGHILTDKVETGTVLDAEGTNYFKMTQMAKVCWLFKNRQVHDGDKFFSMDMWHPGLECIPYMAQLEKLKVEVYAFLHAGSYTTGDFAAPMADWAKYFEKGWFELCTKVFVGSEYHKRKFMLERCGIGIPAHPLNEKMIVTGNPLDTEEIKQMGGPNILPVAHRDNIIVFPHRWDKEKNPERFVKLVNELWRVRQDFRVLITTSRGLKTIPAGDIINALPCDTSVEAGLSKEAYYRLLASAKVFVSTTIEENFGYCLAEAVTLGCSPVVENAFSHPELLQGIKGCMFRSDEEAVQLLNRHLDAPVDCSASMSRYNNSVLHILENMGVVGN